MARALVEKSPRTMSMLAFADDEPHRSVQLYGVDPTTIGAAVVAIVRPDSVDSSVGNAITLFGQLCIPSPLYPAVPPVCAAL